LLLALAACGETNASERNDVRSGSSPPLTEAVDACEIAMATILPKTEPIEHTDEHNIYRLGDRIISGSKPHGETALKRIADMGVKTILSVDGKFPDVETATERLRLAKVFGELEGPFYVHCFPGKRRGPAAPARGRVVVDGVSRKQALAEMRQWCGTSRKYRGLDETIGRSRAPSPTRLSRWNGTSRRPAGSRDSAGAMIEISRAGTISSRSRRTAGSPIRTTRTWKLSTRPGSCRRHLLRARGSAKPRTGPRDPGG
jgi:hypothetical protein